ncbi:TetR family transcriptional regulator [Sphaerisporangium melleum]|uniref:TetR family transcriptional regulator n=1 Tax=Sphaerisporangium melleum TaxID=321316 RepID=A0A917QSX8_9ACTN|nr:TetR/AcrR family transcriptional regulator [Sphaerisporangium melleum]GGK66910.1 TetR family transcriptional regulator [Sphaerisporangium melleum]GII68537.1 TetR family transcriptional regulator [Sphaerisporangium melleum]
MTPPEPAPQRADARRNRARILDAAAAVFAAHGASASTEQIAARAGVAIGTVFRHFPTKKDLLRAIVKDLMERLTAEVAELAADGDPATALFAFFDRMVREAGEKKTVADLLAADAGVEVPVAGPVQALREGIGVMLDRAQRAGAVREDVRLDEVLALLTAACQGALAAGWDDDLRRRTLAIVYTGLRPGAASARPAG